MGRKVGSKQVSSYNYRAEFKIENQIHLKYYFTMQDIADDFGVHLVTIFKMINRNYRPQRYNLKNVNFYKDKKSVEEVKDNNFVYMRKPKYY